MREAVKLLSSKGIVEVRRGSGTYVVTTAKGLSDPLNLRSVQDKNALQPLHPVDIAPQLKVPVLGLYGGKDAGIPLDTVEQMRAALARGSSHSDIHVYADAGHGFHADYRPGYVEADAKDGWKRCTDWLKRHGV